MLVVVAGAKAGADVKILGNCQPRFGAAVTTEQPTIGDDSDDDEDGVMLLFFRRRKRKTS